MHSLKENSSVFKGSPPQQIVPFPLVYEDKETEQVEETWYSSKYTSYSHLHMPCSHLHVPLWLHEAAHDPKTSKELSRLSMCGHARNDSVVRPLVRSHYVGVGGVEHKVGSTVLQFT